MNILVTGTTGQLGFDVVNEVKKRGYNPIELSKSELDLTNTSKIKNTIVNKNPNAIIHCAAYTNVDLAQDNESLCRVINSLAVKEIAISAKILNIPLIYISTDYVFDGNKESEYVESDMKNPINVYGKYKYEGEKYVEQFLKKYYIVRTAWVFGENGNNFVKTMIKLSKEKDSLNVINDTQGSPTYSKDLAVLLLDMLSSDKYGVYHATNEGFCTWYEFAQEIFKIKNIKMNLNPISSNDYLVKAPRPVNSKLCKNKLIEYGFKPLRNWKDALYDYLSDKE